MRGRISSSDERSEIVVDVPIPILVYEALAMNRMMA
jgi:hypothetical protein